VKLPKLENWVKTRDSLRLALEPLRSARLEGTSELPNALHHALFPHFAGARTGPLSFGGELFLDYTTQKIVFRQNEKKVFEVPLAGYSQKYLFQQTAEEFKKLNINISPYKDKVESGEELDINPEHAEKYAQLQFRVFNAMARARGHFFGVQTPISIWPHGFDLSTVWFPGGADESRDPHMNFGFSPGYAGIDEPYLYFYAWPVPQGLLETELPMGGFWYKDWATPTAVILLSSFAGSENPDREITKIFLDSYWEVSPKLSG